MRVGVLILPEHTWRDAAPMWRRAEELGFDHAWTYDHIAWGPLRDAPWFASVPTLAAAATVTSRIRLGTLVASPSFRHPVPLARELITLDDLSGGRLTLGIGAGGHGWDATILADEPWSLAERAARFEEFVELLDALLSNPRTDHRGRHYRANDVRLLPGCVQRPRVPFAVAATGPRGMALAARHAQTWVTNGDRSHEGPPLRPADGAEVVERQTRRLEEACERVGRDPATLDRLVLTGPRLDPALGSAGAFRDAVHAYAEVGVTDLVVHWPRPSAPYAGDPDALRFAAPG